MPHLVRYSTNCGKLQVRELSRRVTSLLSDIPFLKPTFVAMSCLSPHSLGEIAFLMSQFLTQNQTKSSTKFVSSLGFQTVISGYLKNFLLKQRMSMMSSGSNETLQLTAQSAAALRVSSAGFACSGGNCASALGESIRGEGQWV